MHKRTIKATVPLGGLSFMVTRACYSTAIEKFRSGSSKLFWHDEIWCNQYEEKLYVWTDGTTDTGDFRQSDEKG